MIESYKINTKHAFNAKELYEGWNKEKYVRITEKQYGQSILRLCGLVFCYCLVLIIKDIIFNKITFKLPLADAYIEMTPIKGDDFINMKKLGLFANVDYLASNFQGFMLLYRHKEKKGWFKRFIFTNKPIVDMITELTNKGLTW